MAYQFVIESRKAGPFRQTWHDAAKDAIRAGGAKMTAQGLRFFAGGAIVKVPDRMVDFVVFLQTLAPGYAYKIDRHEA